MSRVRVAGIGNALAGDDGIGLRVIEMMRETMQTGDWKDVELRFTGAPGPELFSGLDQHDLLILIDGCRSGAETGTIHCISTDALGSSRLRHCSTHGFTLSDWIDLAYATGEAVPKMILFGVEIEQCGMGEPISAAVADALPSLLGHVQDCIRHHAGVAHA